MNAEAIPIMAELPDEEKGMPISQEAENQNPANTYFSVPLHLTTLPAEIHLNIFDYLNPETAACLGLTCKKFCPLFFARHAKTPLLHDCRNCGLRSASPYKQAWVLYDYSQHVSLVLMLREWVPTNLVFDKNYTKKFVRPERLPEIREEKRQEIKEQIWAIQEDMSKNPEKYADTLFFDRDF